MFCIVTFKLKRMATRVKTRSKTSTRALAIRTTPLATGEAQDNNFNTTAQVTTEEQADTEDRKQEVLVSPVPRLPDVSNPETSLPRGEQELENASAGREDDEPEIILQEEIGGKEDYPSLPPMFIPTTITANTRIVVLLQINGTVVMKGSGTRLEEFTVIQVQYRHFGTGRKYVFWVLAFKQWYVPEEKVPAKEIWFTPATLSYESMPAMLVMAQTDVNQLIEGKPNAISLPHYVQLGRYATPMDPQQKQLLWKICKDLSESFLSTSIKSITPSEALQFNVYNEVLGKQLNSARILVWFLLETRLWTINLKIDFNVLNRLCWTTVTYLWLNTQCHLTSQQMLATLPTPNEVEQWMQSIQNYPTQSELAQNKRQRRLSETWLKGVALLSNVSPATSEVARFFARLQVSLPEGVLSDDAPVWKHYALKVRKQFFLPTPQEAFCHPLFTQLYQHAKKVIKLLQTVDTTLTQVSEPLLEMRHTIQKHGVFLVQPQAPRQLEMIRLSLESESTDLPVNQSALADTDDAKYPIDMLRSANPASMDISSPIYPSTLSPLDVMVDGKKLPIEEHIQQREAWRARTVATIDAYKAHLQAGRPISDADREALRKSERDLVKMDLAMDQIKAQQQQEPANPKVTLETKLSHRLRNREVITKLRPANVLQSPQRYSPDPNQHMLDDEDPDYEPDKDYDSDDGSTPSDAPTTPSHLAPGNQYRLDADGVEAETLSSNSTDLNKALKESARTYKEEQKRRTNVIRQTQLTTAKEAGREQAIITSSKTKTSSSRESASKATGSTPPSGERGGNGDGGRRGDGNGGRKSGNGNGNKKSKDNGDSDDSDDEDDEVSDSEEEYQLRKVYKRNGTPESGISMASNSKNRVSASPEAGEEEEDEDEGKSLMVTRVLSASVGRASDADLSNIKEIDIFDLNKKYPATTVLQYINMKIMDPTWMPPQTGPAWKGLYMHIQAVFAMPVYSKEYPNLRPTTSPPKYQESYLNPPLTYVTNVSNWLTAQNVPKIQWITTLVDGLPKPTKSSLDDAFQKPLPPTVRLEDGSVKTEKFESYYIRVVGAIYRHYAQGSNRGDAIRKILQHVYKSPTASIMEHISLWKELEKEAYGFAISRTDKDRITAFLHTLEPDIQAEIEKSWALNPVPNGRPGHWTATDWNAFTQTLQVLYAHRATIAHRDNDLLQWSIYHQGQESMRRLVGGILSAPRTANADGEHQIELDADGRTLIVKPKKVSDQILKGTDEIAESFKSWNKNVDDHFTKRQVMKKQLLGKDHTRPEERGRRNEGGSREAEQQSSPGKNFRRDFRANQQPRRNMVKRRWENRGDRDDSKQDSFKRNRMENQVHALRSERNEAKNANSKRKFPKGSPVSDPNAWPKKNECPNCWLEHNFDHCPRNPEAEEYNPRAAYFSGLPHPQSRVVTQGLLKYTEVPNITAPKPAHLTKSQE